MPDVVHEAVIQATPLEFMLATMRDVNQPMLFRAEMAKAAPYVHAQLASTEIKTIGHITPATGTPQRPDAAADGGGACTGHITGRQPPFMRAGNYAFDMWMT